MGSAGLRVRLGPFPDAGASHFLLTLHVVLEPGHLDAPLAAAPDLDGLQLTRADQGAGGLTGTAATQDGARTGPDTAQKGGAKPPSAPAPGTTR